MEVFATEEQQLEALRNWWKDNGLSVLMGIGLGVAAILGWRFWQDMQKTQAEAASDAYEEVLTLAADSSKSAEFAQKAEGLVSSHGGTVYAHFTQLFLAREAAKAGDLDKTAALLQQVHEQASDKALQHIAALRLARVKLAQGDAEAALKMTQSDAAKNSEFKGAYALVRGMALLKLARETEAHAAFEEATQDKEMAAEYPALGMLVDNTNSAQASVVTP